MDSWVTRGSSALHEGWELYNIVIISFFNSCLWRKLVISMDVVQSAPPDSMKTRPATIGVSTGP